MSDGLFQVNVIWVLISFLNVGVFLLFIVGIVWAIRRLREVGRLEAQVRRLQSRVDALEAVTGATRD